MSWNVYLVGDEGVVEVENFTDGGTYAIGGTDRAELNITYNYGVRFREAWDGVGLKEALNDRRAGDVVVALDLAVAHLGIEPDDDYWEPTAGNAGRALARLSEWAHQHPDAVFEVS